MRNYILTITLLLAGQFVLAQKAMSFTAAREQNIRTSLLDSTYANGINGDASKMINCAYPKCSSNNF